MTRRSSGNSIFCAQDQENDYCETNIRSMSILKKFDIGYPVPIWVMTSLKFGINSVNFNAMQEILSVTFDYEEIVPFMLEFLTMYH